MQMETLECIREEKIATVYLNRPPFNPLNKQMYQEIHNLMQILEKDRNVQVVIITGQGDRAFAAGADIHEMMNLSGAEVLEMCAISRDALMSIERMPKPILAAVNGLALGGGCELALACDFRICSETTKLGLPEINLGIIPGSGGTQRLQRLIGQAKAKELLFFGEMITAEEALDYGLVNKVVNLEDLQDYVQDWARKLAEKPAVAMRMLKKSVNHGANIDLDSALNLEITCFGNAFASEDRQEGMLAFIEKRKPSFVNR